MKIYLTFLKFSLISLIGVMLFGCEGSMVPILEGIDQNAVNSVLIELGQHNIDAQKEKVGKEGGYDVLVPQNEQVKALEILRNNGVPMVQYTNLGEVFKKDSFISSPLEEQARFIYALEEQISAMVSGIEGVVSVSTQLTLPPPSDNLLQGQDVKPSAAVLIKFKDGYHLEMYANRIKQLVANSVPGLSPERVEVLFVSQNQLN